MKTPAFWYKKSVTPEAFLLLPLAQIYRLAGSLRRLWAHPYRAKVPVFCIGNLVAGGAGKTPVALALAEILLEKGYKPLFVTRGYGGKERGPLRVDPLRHTAKDVGDEALLLARRAPVWIGRDRAAAIRAAEPHGSHIILDDGLQNPHIKPDAALLVVDGKTGFGNRHLIPAGPLREPLQKALKRVTAAIVVGDKEYPEDLQMDCLILNASLQPCLPETFAKTAIFFAFAGIGRPAKFYETCRKAGLTISGTEDFADHHMYTPEDLERLKQKAKDSQAMLLTTEKDWVRLSPDWQKIVTAFPVKLVFDKTDFLTKLLGI